MTEPISTGPARSVPVPFQVYTRTKLARIPQLQNLAADQRFAMNVVATVLPFRVNQYVIDELIDWDNVPDDPIFQLTFPQREMLAPEHFDRIASLLLAHADRLQVTQAVHEIHRELNPHPAEQTTLNVPKLHGRPLPGMQHKYRETVLFFPSHGQTCHAYCTFCFRWPQFVRDKELRIAVSEGRQLRHYLRTHQEVTDLLVTGGDPMVMKTTSLAAHLEPLLAPEFDHVQNIRIGSKALTYWPYRFTHDADADDLLRLFERIIKAGKHLTLMAHYNHWRELATPAAHAAIKRVQSTGVLIRTQAPVLRHINDDPAVWTQLWREQVKLGMVPYYMFVVRDTGARRYFELPLERTWQIYQSAIQGVSGLAGTVRGPSMSAGPGKVEIQGVTEIQGERVFVLRFLQGRNPDWVERPFFAHYDAHATWLDQLKPAFGAERFFFEDEYTAIQNSGGAVS
jgi:KamA family protein